MDGWLIYAGLIVGAAALLALGRGWWFGLLASIAATFALLLINEGLAFAGPAVAAFAGWMLPPKDAIVAIPVGAVIAVLFLFVVPTAPDSPANVILAGCAALFAAGALAGRIVSALKKRLHGQLSA